MQPDSDSEMCKIFADPRPVDLQEQFYFINYLKLIHNVKTGLLKHEL